jgi:hypothetical protein
MSIMITTPAGSELGKQEEPTISVDREELRAIVREAVQRKFASLTESKTEQVKEGKATPAGSILGGKPVAQEAMGGGVPGGMSSFGGTMPESKRK